jgi:hypothetical protein
MAQWQPSVHINQAKQKDEEFMVLGKEWPPKTVGESLLQEG